MSPKPSKRELDEGDRRIRAILKAQRYKGKPQLRAVTYKFKCSCGKMCTLGRDKLSSARWDNAFGGVGSIGFWCKGCGKGWSIRFEIKTRGSAKELKKLMTSAIKELHGGGK